MNLIRTALISDALVFAIFEQSSLIAKFGRFRVGRTMFVDGIMIVRPLHEFMDLHSVFADGDIGRVGIDPSAAIEIVNSMLWIVLVQSSVGVAAKNAGCLVMTGVRERALGNFLR